MHLIVITVNNYFLSEMPTGFMGERAGGSHLQTICGEQACEPEPQIQTQAGNSPAAPMLVGTPMTFSIHFPLLSGLLRGIRE